MKVSHQTDHATSAVVGSQQVQEMTMASTPEFMQILSESLYKNPTLAMVRETISNAADAHTDAGIGDKPFIVEVTKEHYIVRDLGKGISHDDFAAIYGTYGQGTKANDSSSIGGFGLGCKSPHAYCDVFEVTSCHNGTKTIYSIVKASRQANGKNAIITLLQVPTEETGVTVKVPLKTASDYSSLVDMVKSLVFTGDFNCKLNGNVIQTLGMSMAPCSYRVTKAKVLGGHDTPVYIRYANVLYPLPNIPELEQLKRMVIRYLYRYQSNVLIQAEPNSLSIQPSREAISVTEYSVENLTKLLSKAIAMMEAERDKLVSMLEDAAVEVVKDLSVSMLNYSSLRRRSYMATLASKMTEYNFDGVNPDIVTAHYDNRALTWVDAMDRVYHLAYTKFHNLSKHDSDLLQSDKTVPLAKFFRKELRVLAGIKSKQITSYWSMAAKDVHLKSCKTVNQWIGSDSLIYGIKRNVYLVRTVQSVNELRAQAQIPRIDMYCAMVIRYGNKTGLNLITKLLDEAGIAYTNLSKHEEVLPVLKADKRKATPYMNEDGELRAMSCREDALRPLESLPFSKDVKYIVARDNSKGFTDIVKGSVQSRDIIQKLARDYPNQIAIVPNIRTRTAQKLARERGLGSIGDLLLSHISTTWETNKEEWLHSIAVCDDTLYKYLNTEFTGRVRHYAEIMSKLGDPLFTNWFTSYSEQLREFRELLYTVRYSRFHRMDNPLGVLVSSIQESVEQVKPSVSRKAWYRLKAVSLYERMHVFNLPYLTTDDTEVIKFINKQLKVIENEYKNKDCSHSRNYGHYHPVQSRR